MNPCFSPTPEHTWHQWQWFEALVVFSWVGWPAHQLSGTRPGCAQTLNRVLLGKHSPGHRAIKHNKVTTKTSRYDDIIWLSTKNIGQGIIHPGYNYWIHFVSAIQGLTNHPNKYAICIYIHACTCKPIGQLPPLPSAENSVVVVISSRKKGRQLTGQQNYKGRAELSGFQRKPCFRSVYRGVYHHHRLTTNGELSPQSGKQLENKDSAKDFQGCWAQKWPLFWAPTTPSLCSGMMLVQGKLKLANSSG